MRGQMRAFWLVLAVAFTAVAVLLCAYAAMIGALYIRPAGDPQETVVRFFDGIIAGDYADAYACLSDYASLGLEQVPETKDAQLLYQALRGSYGYQLAGDCRVQDLSATQRVRFSFLNVEQAVTDAAGKVDGILEAIAEERERSEIADEEGHFLPEVNEEAYLTALHEVLADPTHYTRSTELELRLDYNGTEWLITTSSELLSALIGGLS